MISKPCKGVINSEGREPFEMEAARPEPCKGVINTLHETGCRGVCLAETYQQPISELNLVGGFIISKPCKGVIISEGREPFEMEAARPEP
jgi:hypothetical protein